MKNLNRILCFIAILAFGQASNLHAAVPGMIHYQGYVTVNNTPFTGAGSFKFAFVDKPGTTTFWSHDGSGTGGAAPSTEINVIVSGGVYSVLLGDRDVAGMTQNIPTTVFEDNTSVYLRVWFNDGVNGSQQLTPDTRIASVGYAMAAAKVIDGGLTDEAFKPNVTLGGANTAGTLTLKSGGDQTRAVIDAGAQDGISSLKLYDATGTFDTARLVGAESGGTGAQLLLKNGAGHTTLEFDAQNGTSTTADGAVRLKKDDGSIVLMLRADLGSNNSGLLLFDAAGLQETVRLTGSHSGTKGGFLSLKNSTSSPTIQLDAQGDADDADSWGALFLGNGDLERSAELTGDGGEGQGKLILRRTSNEERAILDADGVNNGGELKLYDWDGSETINLRGAQGSDAGGTIRVGNKTGDVTAELSGDGGESQGKLILKHADLQARVIADGDGVNNGGEVKVFDSDGTMTVNIRGAAGLSNGALIELSKANGTPTITLSAESNGEGKITTQVLQITGGSDLSEQFEISAPAENLITPGSIVCIDPDRPGELRVSDRPYDSTVAGIISGAGGVKPGMLMGQAGTRADGQHPVALTGRVYCQVDASHGAIKPGDLITTSPTPGHGMKADPAQAPGAIIGKAMTPLSEGRGLVLVLVSLQ